VAAAAPSVPSGAITTRDDAIRGLGRICEWIERNEPSSPAPLFIRRSQQLLQMSFIDIVRDLLPDNVRQIEHFAGKSTS
jgi:type VI secretion system protein ImpA